MAQSGVWILRPRPSKGGRASPLSNRSAKRKSTEAFCSDSGPHREKKNEFLYWLRSNGFLVVAKDGEPGDGKHCKAKVDVLMAIDAVELSVEMRPDVVVLVTGDADFAHLALQLVS